MFCNRKDLNMGRNGSVFICADHFEEKYMKRNDKQPRLIKKLLPVPTIHPSGIYDEKPSCMPTTPSTHKAPTQRVYLYTVRNFADINQSLLKFLPNGYKTT